MSISGKREKPEDVDDYTEELAARKYLLNNYSLLSYMIEDNQYFKSSNNSLSFSPYEDGEKWRYNTSFNYFEFAKNVSKLNCYSSIDRLLKFKFKWIDLYGNEFWKSPGESAVLTGYSDKITALSEWTSAGYGYKVVKCGNRPVFEFILTFDSGRYDNMEKDELKGIISRYQKLYLQLNDENGIRVYINAAIFASEENIVFEFDGERIESLKKWLFGDNSVYSYIWNKYNDTEASVPDKLTVSFDIEINSNYTEKQIFELNVSFIISRTKNAVMGGLYTLNGISKAETIIPPLSEKKDNEEERTVVYEGFNLLKIQNAKGGLELKRNEEIIAGQKTNDDFVYNTGVISFENAYFPLICNYEKIDISSLSQEDKDTISNYLKAWFNNLIPDDNNVSIQMQVYYSYNLNSAFDNVKYPIFMKSIEKCSKEQLLDNCRSWGEYMENWKKNNINEYIKNSKYLFDIIIYSSYSDKPKPLLHMTNVILPTNKIKDVGLQ